MLVAIQAFPDSYFSLTILFAVSVARSIHQLAVFKGAGPMRAHLLHGAAFSIAPQLPRLLSNKKASDRRSFNSTQTLRSWELPISDSATFPQIASLRVQVPSTEPELARPPARPGELWSLGKAMLTGVRGTKADLLGPGKGGYRRGGPSWEREDSKAPFLAPSVHLPSHHATHKWNANRREDWCQFPALCSAFPRPQHNKR